MAAILKSAILNSAILDSDTAIMDWDTLLSSLRWTQKHSPSTLTLTQTNSIWLTRWWQPSWILPSWILPSWIQPFAQKNFTHSFSLKLMIAENLVFCSLGCSHFAQKKTSLIHSDSTWWWQPSWILPCWIETPPSWIQTPVYFSQINSKTHFLHSLTLNETYSI